MPEVPITHEKVSAIPDGDDETLVRPSDWNKNHVVTGGLPVPELRLIPKASSSGAEGTMFYDEADNHVYVATE